MAHSTHAGAAKIRHPKSVGPSLAGPSFRVGAGGERGRGRVQTHSRVRTYPSEADFAAREKRHVVTTALLPKGRAPVGEDYAVATGPRQGARRTSGSEYCLTTCCSTVPSCLLTLSPGLSAPSGTGPPAWAWLPWKEARQHDNPRKNEVLADVTVVSRDGEGGGRAVAISPGERITVSPRPAPLSQRQ